MTLLKKVILPQRHGEHGEKTEVCFNCYTNVLN